MAKFKVIYTEVFKKVYIVEAENEEEAREKMELARKLSEPSFMVRR